MDAVKPSSVRFSSWRIRASRPTPSGVRARFPGERRAQMARTRFATSLGKSRVIDLLQLQSMTLEGVENQHHAAIAHDGGSVELLAVLQSAGQRLHEHLDFAPEMI